VPVTVEEVFACQALANPAMTIPVTTSEEGLVVHLDAELLDPIDTVLQLEIEGPPEEIIEWIKPDADGDLALAAAVAVVEGGAKLEEIGGQKNIGFWTNAGDRVAWHATLPAGHYRLSAHVAAPAGTKLTIVVGSARADVSVEATGSYQTFVQQDWGELNIGVSGNCRIELQPTPGAWHPINLRRLELSPVD
jgi:hypothetical protein